MAGLFDGQEMSDLTKRLQSLLNIPSTTQGTKRDNSKSTVDGTTGERPNSTERKETIVKEHQTPSISLRSSNTEHSPRPSQTSRQNEELDRKVKSESSAHTGTDSALRPEPVNLNAEADFAATKLVGGFAFSNGQLCINTADSHLSEKSESSKPSWEVVKGDPSQVRPQNAGPNLQIRDLRKGIDALDVWLAMPSVSKHVRDARSHIIRTMELELTGPKLSEAEVHLMAGVTDLFDAFHIKKLATKVAKFPNAKHWCHLCNYHLDTLVNALTHMVNERHVKAEVSGQTTSMVDRLNEISYGHQDTITETITKLFRDYGLTKTEEMVRIELCKRMHDDLHSVDYDIEVFGSSVSGFGFEDSDVNLNIAMPNRVDATGSDKTFDCLNSISQKLKTLNYVRDLTEDRSSKWYSISFTDCISGKVVNIQMNNTTGVACAKLFAEYAKVDARVRPLVIAFRSWARLTDSADVAEGTLPGFCYSIMTIHYLQEMKVIPILHNLSNITTSSGDFTPFQTAEEALKTWTKKSTHSVGLLWVGMLKYYAVFQTLDKVVSISQPGPSRKTDKAWNRKLSIEDPILPKTNLSRCLSSNKVCDYIFDRIRAAYIYFATPRTADGPLYEGIIPLRNIKPMDKVYYYEGNPLLDVLRQMHIGQTRRGKPMTGPVEVIPFSATQKMIVHYPNTNTDAIAKAAAASLTNAKPKKNSANSKSNASKKKTARLVDMLDCNGKKKVYVIQEDIYLLTDTLEETQYHYEFNREILQGDEKPPLYCKACSYDGHLKKDCPEETIPRMRLVPVAPTAFTLRVLSKVMQRNFELEALNDNDVRIRKRITEDIRSALVEAFSDVDLTMFGSTYNGFGLHMSDVDICMRLKNVQLSKADMQTEEVNGILKTVVRQLKAAGCMQEILAIPSAKVPIVKFRHRMSRLEGDISLSNVLALHNTTMLRTYAEIDGRLKILGCFLKKVTKLCDISDASKGSLSSYGYVLMIIHFLQQHNPPVLPVLQELPTGPNPPVLVETCNAYFFSDIKNLKTVWPHYGKNKESVSELWTAFLQYYTERFKFDEQVITINQFEPLSRFSKFWLSETVIAIEDPFERSHNLGAGLSRRMGVHIVKAFQRFREVFSIPIDEMGNTDWMMWYLDSRRIRGNTNPPVDRQCRICNRIGHFAKNCTFFSTGEDSSYSYKDEEAPTHQTRNRNYAHKDEDLQNRNRNMGNFTNRQPLPPKPGYQNRTNQSQNQSRAAPAGFEKRPMPSPIGPPRHSVQSREYYAKSDVSRPFNNDQNERRSMDTGRGESHGHNVSNIKSQKNESSAVINRNNINTRPNVTSNHPQHQKIINQNPIQQSPEIQFFGVGGQDSDKVIEAMISRNPGVVFQLRDREVGTEPQSRIGSNGQPSESPLLNIGPITPPTEYRSAGNRSPGNGHRGSATFSPPPGFHKQSNPPNEDTDSQIGRHGLSFFSSPVPQMGNSLGGFSSSNNSSSMDGVDVTSNDIPRHYAPPPGFSSLPTAPPFPTHPPQVGISNNFQVAGNMYQQLTAPMNLAAVPFPAEQNQMRAAFPIPTDQNPMRAPVDHQFSGGVPIPIPSSDGTTTNMNDTMASVAQQVTSAFMNGLIQSQNYYAHTRQLQEHAQLSDLYLRNGMTSGGNPSPFNNPAMMPMSNQMNNTKSPMMVMRPGDPPNQQSTNNDVLGTASHSYLLSHIHHGPVVSAVPVQTGYHPHMVPMPQHSHPQPFSYGGYPYPYPYPHPMQYHPQMMHHGFGFPQQQHPQQIQSEDSPVISEGQGQCQGQGPIPGTPYQMNSVENKEN